jgi:hypothetical protein
MVLDSCVSGFGADGKLNIAAMKEIMKKMAGQGLRSLLSRTKILRVQWISTQARQKKLWKAL